MPISLVVGLGNPGPEYARTRHNLGWMVLDALARKHGLEWKRERAFECELARWTRPAEGSLWLAKPLTYMNDSGRSAGALARFHHLPAQEVAVVYDDAGIETGRIKVSVTGSAGGHNGVASLLEHVGDGFARFRAGIGPKEPPVIDMKDFVLGPFAPEQLAIIEQQLPNFVQGLELLLARGADHAMNQLNRREP